MENCRSIDGLVTAYVDGEGTAAERAAVGAHLAACPPCRQLAAVEDAARRVVRAQTPAALAGPGEWLTGDSSSTKSGPICATGMESPLTSRRIFTSAECPP